MAVQAFHPIEQESTIASLLEAIHQNPDISENYLFLGQTYFYLNQTKNAIPHLFEFIERIKNNNKNVSIRAVAGVLLGQCYEAENQIVSAKLYYHLAVSLQPNYAIGWYHLGMAYTVTAQNFIELELPKKIEELTAYYSILITFTQEPVLNGLNAHLLIYSLPILFVRYQLLLEWTEDLTQQSIDQPFKSAIQYFHQANACLVLAKPGSSGSTHVGNSIIVQESLENAKLPQQIKYQLIECPAQYGHYLYKKQLYSQAEKYYIQTIKLDPEHWNALNQLALCKLHKKLFTEARGYFKEIISRSSSKQTQADAWYNIAFSYRMQSHWRKAANALREAKLLAPFDEAIEKEEQRLRNLISASLLTSAGTLFHHPSKEMGTEIAQLNQLMMNLN